MRMLQITVLTALLAGACAGNNQFIDYDYTCETVFKSTGDDKVILTVTHESSSHSRFESNCKYDISFYDQHAIHYFDYEIKIGGVQVVRESRSTGVTDATLSLISWIFIVTALFVIGLLVFGANLDRITDLLARIRRSRGVK